MYSHNFEAKETECPSFVREPLALHHCNYLTKPQEQGAIMLINLFKN